MGSLLRNQTPVSIPAHAEPVTVGGKPHVRLTVRGKRQTFPLTRDGKKYLRPSAKWYGQWTDGHGKVQRKPLSRDKGHAQQLLGRHEHEADRVRAGLVDPAEKHARRPLAEHLDDYAAVLAAKDDTGYHVGRTVNRIKAVFAGCEFVYAADVDSAAVGKWLKARRVGSGPVEVPGKSQFTPAEAAEVLGLTAHRVAEVVKRHGLAATGLSRARRYPRATVVAIAERSAKGIGPATQNHYAVALRGFFAWLAREKRAAFNPLENLELVNEEVDVRHARRELSAAEMGRLFTTTSASGRTTRGLTGRQRHALYVAAATTGFRVQALVHMTPGHFDFAAGTATLPARVNKSRKLKVQPLPEDAVGMLAAYARGVKATAALWPGKWCDRAADMLRADLEDAGIPPVVVGRDGTPLHADFHALRHSYITHLGRSGVTLQVVQKLAGHSTPTQTMRYMHVSDEELADAAKKIKLPGVVPAPEKNALKNAQTVRVPLQSTAPICTTGPVAGGSAEVREVA